MTMKNNETSISPTLRYECLDDNIKVRGVRTHTYTEKTVAMKKFLCSACICVCVFVFVYYTLNYVFQHVVVDGTSMNDTLVEGEHLIVNHFTYYFSNPDRYDIIVFRPYYDDPECLYIKRVIGLPGDKVHIKDGYVYINGSKIDEDYCKDLVTSNSGIASDEITLGDNEYFVMGDNRQVSLDSRNPDVGPVSTSQIIGKCIIDFWPLNDFGVFFN